MNVAFYILSLVTFQSRPEFPAFELNLFELQIKVLICIFISQLYTIESVIV